MNNKKWLYGAVGIVVVVIGIWIFMSRTPTTITPVVTDTTLAAPNGTGSGTFKTIIGRAGSYTCTFNTINDAGRTNGAVFVMQGKSRADFRTDDAASGKTIESHIIRTSGLIYSWIDGSPPGTKETDTGASILPKNTKGGGFIGDDISNVSWDCHAWIPNANMFVVPTSISFVAQ